MTDRQMTKVVSAIKKIVSSKEIKITHDKMFGTVEFEYIDKKPKVQRMFQELKKAFRNDGFDVDYRGKSFTVTYKSQEQVQSEWEQETQKIIKLLGI